jgi:hypothetical protein
MKCHPTISHPVAMYTVHKAASVLLHKLTKFICTEIDIPYYSPHHVEHADRFISSVNRGSILKFDTNEPIKCYGPLRRPALLPSFDNYKVIIHLRDPRDGLNSMWFSFTTIHKGIPDHVREKRLRMGIDSFVIERSDDYLERY